MSYVIRHAAQVTDSGELVLSDPLAWRADVSKLSGKRVWVTVELETHIRSTKANAYYWGVVVEMIAREIGDDKDSVHEALKERLLPRREVESKTGKVMDVPASTSLLPSEEFAAYVNACVVWAAQFLGVFIPPAGHVEVKL